MKIHIKNLKSKTVIGAWDWEKKIKQKIIINAKIEYDTSDAIKDDKITHAIDYHELSKEILKRVEETEFELVEKCVSFVLDIIMSNKKAKKATVEIDKPKALRPIAKSVSITGERDSWS